MDSIDDHLPIDEDLPSDEELPNVEPIEEQLEAMRRNGLQTLWLFGREVEVVEEEEEEVEEVEHKDNRNWLELPPDVMSMILLKLGAVNILVSAQWVCSLWWKLSKQPHLFRSIHVERVLTPFGPGRTAHVFSKKFKLKHPSVNSNLKLKAKMVREAIDRSCGKLVEFSVKSISAEELLHYMTEECSSLRCFRYVSCSRCTDNPLIEMAKLFPQLEELEIIDCVFLSKDVLETFGRFCPMIKSCRLNYVSGTDRKMFGELPVAIAQNMPELQHLSLFGCNFLRDDGLKAVLDGCPHLESLDLRTCSGLKFAGDLEERCGSIKVLRLPNDPSGDFEHKLEFYSNDQDYLGYDFLAQFQDFIWSGGLV